LLQVVGAVVVMLLVAVVVQADLELVHNRLILLLHTLSQ
jgi:hypothetical protein